MKLHFFFLAFLIFALPCFAQSGPDTLWTRTYHAGDEDWAQVILPQSDGAFLLAGNTISYKAGKSDFLLMKVDARGKMLWSHAYGREDEDILGGATLTNDGGVLMAGFTLSFKKEQPADTVWTPYLVRTNAKGDAIWTRHYPTAGGGTAYDAIALKDGGFMVAGRTRVEPNGLDASLTKIDSAGNVVWSRNYGGSAWDEASVARQTGDGGFILAGRTYSFGGGSADFYLIRTDSRGDTLWTRTFGAAKEERAYDLQITKDGGFIVAGSTESFGHAVESTYIVRLNARGDSLWSVSFGPKKGSCARSVIELADGSLVIAGYTGAASKPGADIYLAMIDMAGKLRWERTYGGPKWDVAADAVETPDGGFVIAGATKSFRDTGTDVLIVRTAPRRGM